MTDVHDRADGVPDGDGRFITFEGGEASGKSTQVRILLRRLARAGHPSVVVGEPGGTPVGRRLRRLVKYGAVDIGPHAEALLFLAARAQLVTDVIRPALARGDVVVCDRYADSTLAYQGYGRGLDVATLRMLNDFATGGLAPSLTVLLDLAPPEARGRRPRSSSDRFDAEDQDESRGSGASGFHDRVRRGFLDLAEAEPWRWLVLDATASIPDIADRVWGTVRQRLSD